MIIDAAFPGGNIVVEKQQDCSVWLHQDLRDTTEDWFYWYFRVREAPCGKLQFNFTKSPAIGVRGPAVSLDGGRSWQWLGAAAANNNRFEYDNQNGDAELRFSFGMPYLEEDWRRFCDNLVDADCFSQHQLCISAAGRPVEYALLGCDDRTVRHRVALACRHHCCEMMANYVLEGFIERIAMGADETAQWFRKNVQCFIVPFADKDGVENGDQGKLRQPRDHGRDYLGKSIFPETAAIRELLPAWGGELLHAVFDLHCPHIRGKHNENIYLVGNQASATAREQRRFSELLESLCQGPLPFHAADYLPFGQDWNSGANYSSGKGFSRWAAELPPVRMGTAIETPYANAGGAEVNATSAKMFGTDLAAALAAYLNTIF